MNWLKRAHLLFDQYIIDAINSLTEDINDDMYRSYVYHVFIPDVYEYLCELECYEEFKKVCKRKGYPIIMPTSDQTITYSKETYNSETDTVANKNSFKSYIQYIADDKEPKIKIRHIKMTVQELIKFTIKVHSEDAKLYIIDRNVCMK